MEFEDNRGMVEMGDSDDDSFHDALEQIQFASFHKSSFASIASPRRRSKDPYAEESKEI